MQGFDNIERVPFWLALASCGLPKGWSPRC